MNVCIVFRSGQPGPLLRYVLTRRVTSLMNALLPVSEQQSFFVIPIPRTSHDVHRRLGQLMTQTSFTCPWCV